MAAAVKISILFGGSKIATGIANQRSKGDHKNATDFTWVIVSLDSVELGKQPIFIWFSTHE